MDSISVPSGCQESDDCRQRLPRTGSKMSMKCRPESGDCPDFKIPCCRADPSLAGSSIICMCHPSSWGSSWLSSSNAPSEGKRQCGKVLWATHSGAPRQAVLPDDGGNSIHFIDTLLKWKMCHLRRSDGTTSSCSKEDPVGDRKLSVLIAKRKPNLERQRKRENCHKPQACSACVQFARCNLSILDSQHFGCPPVMSEKSDEEIVFSVCCLSCLTSRCVSRFVP